MALWTYNLWQRFWYAWWCASGYCMQLVSQQHLPQQLWNSFFWPSIVHITFPRVKLYRMCWLNVSFYRIFHVFHCEVCFHFYVYNFLFWIGIHRAIGLRCWMLLHLVILTPWVCFWRLGPTRRPRLQCVTRGFVRNLTNTCIRSLNIILIRSPGNSRASSTEQSRVPLVISLWNFYSAVNLMIITRRSQIHFASLFGVCLNAFSFGGNGMRACFLNSIDISFRPFSVLC